MIVLTKSLAFSALALVAASSVASAQTPPPPAAAAPAEALPVPSGKEYAAMTPEQRYALRLRVRTLPDDVRKPWLAQLKANVDSLPDDIHNALHDERNAMDAQHGTKPVE